MLIAGKKKVNAAKVDEWDWDLFNIGLSEKASLTR